MPAGAWVSRLPHDTQFFDRVEMEWSTEEHPGVQLNMYDDACEV